ncbi:MAG: hypothetical protein SFY96_00600 [Planctomycetota bacterium]|nr:hypothetical protein [Planctomycetota bacterium]
MPRWGAYETVREISQHPLGAVWLAHAVGSVTAAADRYVIKTAESSWQLGDPEREAIEVQAFLDVGAEQKRLFELGAKRLVRVHEAARQGDIAYIVLDYHPRSVQRFILGKVRLETRALRAIAEGVLDGLVQLRELGGGRAHGDLKASNVLLSGDPADQSVMPDQVFLADILGPRAVKPADAVQDIRELGKILYQLITHKPARDSAAWSATMGEEWQRLGPDGIWWFDFCSRLADAGVGKPVPTLDAIRDELSAYKPRAAGGKNKTVGIAAAALLVVLAGGSFVAYKTLGGKTGPGGTRIIDEVADWEFPGWLDALTSDPKFVADAIPDTAPESLLSIKKKFAEDVWTKNSRHKPRADEIRGMLMKWADDAETLAKNLTAEGLPIGKTISADVEQLKLVLVEPPPVATTGPDGAPLPAKPDAGPPRPDALKVFREVRNRLWGSWTQIDALHAGVAQAKSTADGLASLAGVDGDAVLSRRAQILAAALAPVKTPEPDTKAFAEAIKALAEYRAGLDEAKRLLAINDENVWRRADFSKENIATNVSSEPSLALLSRWVETARNYEEKEITSTPDPRAGKLPQWATDVAALQKNLAAFRDNHKADLEPDELKAVDDQIKAAEGVSARVDALKARRWVERLQKDIESESKAIPQEIAKGNSYVESMNIGIKEGAEGAITRALASISGDGPVEKAWRDTIKSNTDRLKGLNSKTKVSAEVRAYAEWYTTLTSRFPRTLDEGQKSALLAEAGRVDAQDAERIIVAESDGRIAAAIKSLAFGADLAGSDVAGAADAYAKWRSDAIALVTRHAKVAKLLADARLPDEDDKAVQDSYAAVSADKGAIASVFTSAPALLTRVQADVDGLRALLSQPADAQLKEASTASGTPVRAWAAWRALARQSAWPATPDQLAQALAAKKNVKARLSGLEAQRSNALAALVDADAKVMWGRAAAGAGSAADADAVLAQSEAFGFGGATAFSSESWATLAADAIPSASGRFNILAAILRREIASWPAGEDAAAQRTRVAALRDIVKGAADKLGVPAQGLIELLAKAAEGEPPFEPAAPNAPLPASLFAQKVGIKATADAGNARVVYTFTGPRTKATYNLEFIRLVPPGAAKAVYMQTNEMSLGMVVEVLNAADAWADIQQNKPGGGLFGGWTRDAFKNGPFGWEWVTGQGGRREIGSSNVPDSDANVRVQGKGWYRALGKNLTTKFGATGVLATADLYGSLARPGMPMPMQQIPIGGAALVARLMGCRLPSAAEWSAAADGGVPRASEAPNLRDAWFRQQFDYVKSVDADPGNANIAPVFPPPGAGIAAPASVDAKSDGDPATSASDGVILFRATGDAAAANAFRDLEGNVAEWVYDNPPALDALTPQAGQVGALAQQITDLLGKEADAAAKGGNDPRKIIGGSALSGPWWTKRTEPITVEPKKLFASGAGFYGFADVGFRVVFPATGGTKSPLEQAREALSSQGFVAGK